MVRKNPMELKDLRSLACRDRRDLPLDLCDLKFMDQKERSDGSVQFEGYAALWGRVDLYGDTMVKGAFAKSLKERRPMMFYGHSPGRVVGKYLKVEEDDKGLFVKGETTPGHRDAQDVGASLKHGALNGLSIGGYTVDWEQTKERGRLIKGFDLWEISVVSMPAEQEARIDSSTVKSMLDECHTVSDMEELLREAAGLSKSMATAFVARLRRISRGEPDGNGQQKAADDLLSLVRGSAIPTSLTNG